MLRSVLQDVIYGARMLRKDRVFAVVAILTLAVGIGANTVVFSVLNTLYFRTAPVRTPGELVTTLSTHRYASLAEYSYYREHNASFVDLAAEYATAHLYLQAGNDPRIVLAAIVSDNYFDLLGVRPAMGRFFVPRESSEGTTVAVLSYRMWQRDFSADGNIIGKTVRLNGTSALIIGVTPQDFHRLYAGVDQDLWLSIASAPAMLARCKPPNPCQVLECLIGRLKPGSDLRSAQTELNGLSAQWETMYPDLDKSTFTLYEARGIDPHSRRDLSYLSPLLVAIVAVLLLIGCANLSGLLLARGAARSKEIAVRLALGAGRSRIVRQLLTEAAMLGIAGGLCGILLLVWSSSWLSLLPFASTEGFRSYYNLGLDMRVFLSTLLLSIVTVLVFGTLPALRTSSLSAMSALKQTDIAGAHGSRVRAILVVGQVTLAIVLSVGAVLVAGSLNHILLGPGFDAGHVAIVRVSPYQLGYTPDKSAAVQKEALRRLAALPGVQSVTFGQLMPWWESWQEWIALPGHEDARDEARIRVHYNSIAPNFLRTLQIPLLRGREFADSDRKGSPNVVIVNETLALRMWSNPDPVGQTLVISGDRYTVVGVAGDAQYSAANEGAHSFFYLPYWQIQNNGDSRFLVRTAGDPAALLPVIKRTIRAIDANVPVGEDASMLQALLNDFGPLRLTRAILIFSGAAALFLSAVGLYSVLSFLVAWRTREIGIRLALGATRAGVLKLFLRQGMKLALAGAVAGIVLTLGSMRVLSNLLYGISPTDRLTILAVSIFLLAICALASIVPARRATKVDPMIALRHE